MWTRLEALGGGRYQSQLQVQSAVQLHAGSYTCRALDWEAKDCRTLQLSVRRAPQVHVAPMASTLRRVSCQGGKHASMLRRVSCQVGNMLARSGE